MIGPEFHGGGHPWHGLCEDGDLTLPNADIKTYPQPAGGDCFKLVVPGFTAPTRNAVQIAADVAQGYSWPGYALLSGDTRAAGGLQVYGKPLGPMRWIWAISPSEKWLVNASALVVAAGVISGNLTLTRFGLHQPGVAAEVLTVPVSAAVDITATIGMRVMDMSASGAAVLVGLYAFAEGTYNATPFKPSPAAVVEIKLAGDPPAATITAVYGAADFIQGVTPIGAVYENTTFKKISIAVTRPGYYVYHVALRRDTTEIIGFDVSGDWVFTLTNPPPPATTEFLAPTIDPVNLVSPQTGTIFSQDVVTIAEINTYAQGIINKLNALPIFDVVHQNETTLLTSVACRWGGNIEPGCLDASGSCAPKTVIKMLVAPAIEIVAQAWTDVDGKQHKRDYSTVRVVYDQWSVSCDGSGVNGVTYGGQVSTTVGKSLLANYFRGAKSGATGAIDWGYTFSQSDAQDNTRAYYYCPDLYVPGTPYNYIYNVAVTYKLTAAGVDTLFGPELFQYSTALHDIAEVNPSRINLPDKGNADRIEFFVDLSSVDPLLRRPAFGEAIFVNPCAGLYGLSFRRILDPGVTPNLLHGLVKKDGTSQVWAGWTAYGPHDYRASLHPDTLAIAYDPVKAVCFV